MISLVVGLTAVAASWAFLFWCVFWVCMSNMDDFFKACIVVFCVVAFFSIRFEYVDDGKNHIRFGETKNNQAEGK